MFLLKAKGLLLALYLQYFEQKADIYISHMDGGVNSFAIIYYFLQQNSQKSLSSRKSPILPVYLSFRRFDGQARLIYEAVDLTANGSDTANAKLPIPRATLASWLWPVVSRRLPTRWASNELVSSASANLPEISGRTVSSPASTIVLALATAFIPLKAVMAAIISVGARFFYFLSHKG